MYHIIKDTTFNKICMFSLENEFEKFAAAAQFKAILLTNKDKRLLFLLLFILVYQILL